MRKQQKKNLAKSDTKKQRRIKRTTGDFVKIPFNAESHCYARVLDEPLMLFYDAITDIDWAVEEIKKRPAIFTVWVMNSAVTSGRWRVVGNLPLEGRERVAPAFFKQDALNPDSFSIYHNGIEQKATRSECKGLECAAVWSAEHVEDRLRDHYAGRANKWVESLRIQK